MGKRNQMKDSDGNIYPITLMKNVNNINIKAGQSITDALIKKASMIVVYYTLYNAEYLKSIFIPRGQTIWYMDVGDGRFIYIMCNWTDGQIVISPYATDHEYIRVKGYTILS